MSELIERMLYLCGMTGTTFVVMPEVYDHASAVFASVSRAIALAMPY